MAELASSAPTSGGVRLLHTPLHQPSPITPHSSTSGHSHFPLHDGEHCLRGYAVVSSLFEITSDGLDLPLRF